MCVCVVNSAEENLISLTIGQRGAVWNEGKQKRDEAEKRTGKSEGLTMREREGRAGVARQRGEVFCQNCLKSVCQRFCLALVVYTGFGNISA